MCLEIHALRTYSYVHPRFLASFVDYRSSHAFSSCGLGKTREIPVVAREKERKKKGDRETAPDRQRRPDRPRDRSDEEATTTVDVSGIQNREGRGGEGEKN